MCVSATPTWRLGPTKVALSQNCVGLKLSSRLALMPNIGRRA